MKRVVSPDEVAHLWAHQTQSDARNARGNIFFEGKTIYSYGSHFPIATWTQNAVGESAVLFTTRTYSVTTARHISMVRQAINHVDNVFNVPLGKYIDAPTTNDAIKSYQDRIEEIEAKIARARKPEWLYSQLERLVTEANRYCQFFGVVARFTLRDTDGFAELKKTLAATRKVELAAKRERQRLIALENADKVERWLNGEQVWLPRSLDTIYLRVEGNEVVSSMGARFPVSHARRGLALVKAVKASGQEWVTNGHTLHLGPYKVDRIDSDGNVKAGCHFVQWAQIERIAPMIESAMIAPTPATEGIEGIEVSA